MALPELYILRHGETVWNREGRMQGRRDSSLTEKGVVQARAIGRLLSARGLGPGTHQVISSPQGRARRTAEIAFGEAWEIAEDDRLAEICVGDWTGRTRTEVLAVDAHAFSEGDMMEFYANAPGGEGFASMWARARGFLDDLSAPTIVVTHGITSRFLRGVALGIDEHEIAELPGGQGVVHHIREGRTDLIQA